jgi:hypothetical protein
MQKIATKVFIYASILFGILGLTMILTGAGPDEQGTEFSQTVARLLMADVFIILPAFALSVAGKYLNGK